MTCKVLVACSHLRPLIIEVRPALNVCLSARHSIQLTPGIVAYGIGHSLRKHPFSALLFLLT